MHCCGLYNLLSHNLGCDSQPGCGTVTISNNGAGCTREDILAGGACPTSTTTVAVEPSTVAYPNPANNTLTVSVTDEFTGTYQLAIYDHSMNVVKQQTLTKTDTSINSQIDIQSVPKGMYILRLRRPDGEIFDSRLAVVK
jgi:hypothetical protein